MSKALTPKRERFVQEYLVDLNATQAAIRAGYSEKTAYSQGQRLLKDVEIATGIEAARTKMAQKTELNREWLLENLKGIALDSERDGDRVSAMREIGKLLGLYEERVVHRGEGLRLVLNVRRDPEVLPAPPPLLEAPQGEMLDGGEPICDEEPS